MYRIICLLVGLLLAGHAFARPSEPISIDEHNKLVYWRVCLDNVADFQKQGIVGTTDAYNAAVKTCVEGAKKALGRDIGFNEIMQQVKTTHELTTSQKVAGWVTGFTWMQVLATVGIGVFGSIFLFYALPLITSIPKVVYEFFLYALGLGIVVYALGMSGSGYLWGFIGTILLIGAQSFSVHAHKLKGAPWKFFLIVVAYASVIAFLFQSTLIGFVAVTALLCAAGFVAYAFGLGYVVGFQDEKSVPIGTTVAFLLLGVYLGMRILNIDEPYIQIFAPGAFWMGSFVGFIGLLIMSSKWYGKGMHFVFANLLLPVAGVSAILLGSIYGVPELSRIGGTFLVLWVIEKYVELTMHGLLSASFFGLIGSGVLYWFASWALSHSDKVGSYLLFVS